MTVIDTTLWERSSDVNWASPSSTSLKMLQNVNHDYIVSDVEFANYTLTADVTTLQGDDDGIGVVFDYIDNQNYKYIMYQGGGLSFHTLIGTSSITLVEVLNGVHTVLTKNTSFNYWTVNSTFSIKLENVFDDIVFYVNGLEAFKYKKDNSVSGKIGFVTYSQICDFDNIEIFQSNANRLKAKFKLIAVGNSDVNTEIVARPLRESDTFTEIYARALGITDKDTYLNVMYRGNSDVLTEIQPIGYNNMPTEIEVRPHNRMWALYEVQQPPIITEIFNPTQDSFTRESSAFETINYGSNSSMVVGRSQDEIWRSFVQFDLSSINPSYRLTESYLRLYYKGVIPESVKIEILNSDREWQEHNITNLNRPNPIELITNEFSVNEAGGYIEFNVLDIVEDWVGLLQINNGFFIRISNETVFGQATFHTREAILPPELVVKYYDSRIFSHGKSQHITEIFVFRRNDSDVNTEITVDSVFSFSKHDTEIYVHRYEVPVPNDILVEIEVTKSTTHSEITATIRDSLEANAEISVWDNKTSTIDTEITVSKYKILTQIDSALRDDIEAPVEVVATKPSIHIEISVPEYRDSEVLTEIDINSIWNNSVNTEITVSKENITTVIYPRVTRNKDLYTEISVTRPAFHVEVEVKTANDIWVEIEPNIKSDVVTEITISKPCIYTELWINGYDNSSHDTEIFAKYGNTINTEIDSRATNQVLVEINTLAVSQIPTEITASKPRVHTEIVIPTWVDYDVPTVIEPRILMVNNVYTIIQVGSVGGAYAFII